MSRVVLHAVPYITKISRSENSQGSLQSGMRVSKSKTSGRFCHGLDRNIVVQYSVGPIITLHDRITAREYMDRLGNQVYPMIKTLFPNSDAVFQEDNASFTQPELSSHGLNFMKVNFNIFSGQHNRQN
jgi:hypothetical protein